MSTKKPTRFQEFKKKRIETNQKDALHRFKGKTENGEQTLPDVKKKTSLEVDALERVPARRARIDLRDGLALKERVEAKQKEALYRYKDRTKIRQQTLTELKTKTPLEVDSPDRVAARRTLIDPRDGLAFERLIGTSDLLPISYFEAGLIAGKPVCRIEVHDQIGRVLGYGTGFLVSSSLLITNHHVLGNAEEARFSLAQFNYETDLHFQLRSIKSFRLDPDTFYLTDENLDFSLVAVEPTSAEGGKLSEFGAVQLVTESGKALKGEYVSIIQHPAGSPKTVAIRENEVVDVFDNFIHYATDTEPGSSGSPVFSDGWQAVALHHAGVPDPQDSGKYVANEGIRISSIMRFLTTQRKSLSSDQKILLDSILTQGSTKPAVDSVSTKMEVGDLGKEWYEGMTGYDEKFLGGKYGVAIPTLHPDFQKDVAPLTNGGDLLHYTHFSILTSKSRRLAFFTAVNIDGSQSENIKRDADKWYFDPRLNRKYQCGPELYANNDLDRGHLVRRLDPVWGKDATEANEDTFHFTNCSPQHKNLNQKTWQNLEDYILKNAGKFNLKVTVFTGPIFRDDDLLYRNEFQIPAEYWKVVVMVKDDGKMSATAYIQTQKNLIQDLEFAYGCYKTYQIPIEKIERLTRLNFGQLRNYDPIATIEATVGSVIERPEDIRL